MANTLSERLKHQTKQNHQQLEKRLIPYMRSITNQDEYVKLLQIFYSYFGALEDKIHQYIGKEKLPDCMERRKTQSIANDIETLGGVIPEKASGNDLPVIQDQAQAFGALYVIEGSTLGGKIISQIIAKQLNFTDRKSLSFFNGYGDDTDKMWLSFKAILDHQFPDEAKANKIISSANATFLKFKLWVEKLVKDD